MTEKSRLAYKTEPCDHSIAKLKSQVQPGKQPKELLELGIRCHTQAMRGILQWAADEKNYIW